MIPPHIPEGQRAERIRKLIALEISRIVEDLEARRDFLLQVWSAHRKREPFLETVFSRWSTLDFPMLAELETDEVAIVEAFYRELDDFRLYIGFTQDMPTTLGDRYDELIQRLTAYGELALERLGGAPERPLVEFEDETEQRTAALLEFPIQRIADPSRVADPSSAATEGDLRVDEDGEPPPEAG